MAKFDVHKRQSGDDIIPDSAGLIPDPVSPSEYSGRVRILYATIVFELADAAGNYTVATLPKGARIMDAKFNVIDALAAGNSILGDAVDDNRFITAVSTAVVGQFGTIADAGFGYKLTADTPIIFNTLANPVADDSVAVWMLYTLD